MNRQQKPRQVLASVAGMERKILCAADATDGAKVVRQELLKKVYDPFFKDEPRDSRGTIVPISQFSEQGKEFVFNATAWMSAFGHIVDGDDWGPEKTFTRNNSEKLNNFPVKSGEHGSLALEDILSAFSEDRRRQITFVQQNVNLEGHGVSYADTQILYDNHDKNALLQDAQRQLPHQQKHDIIAAWDSIKALTYIEEALIPMLYAKGVEHLAAPTTLTNLHVVVMGNQPGAKPGMDRDRPIMSRGYTSIYPYPAEIPGVFYQGFTRLLRPPEDVHPLIWAARIFAAFLYIHPFHDGNGRTARILANAIIVMHGMPLTVLPHETVIDRFEYIKSLARVAFDDMESLYSMFLDSVLVTNEEIQKMNRV